MAMEASEVRVTPGVLTDGCPDPREIVCIETTKVYDFCFQEDNRDNLIFPIPAHCGPCPERATVSCEVGDVSCTETSRTPLMDGGGLANVSLIVTVPIEFTIATAEGDVVCRFHEQFAFMKTVTLCAPPGTTIACMVPSSSCGATFIAGRNVHVSVTICLLIEANALVKLLVPSFGFCVPAECVTLPTPPVECPPDNIFPPQCGPR